MPIEIRELIIKAEVGKDRQIDKKGSRISDAERQQLLQECVDQVMEIIKQEKER